MFHKKAMLAIFPLAFALGFAFAFVDSRRRRKGVNRRVKLD